MKVTFYCTIGVFLLHVHLFAQNPIPNPGFENWTSIDPEGWFTSNSPGGNNSNLTRSTPGYTGEFAAKGEVIVWPNTPGFPFIPVLESETGDFGFPLSERYGNMSLYFQFHKAGPEDVFTIFVGVLDSEGSVFGGGFAEVSEEVDTFTLLDIPLSYSAEVMPYRAFVSMTINNNTGGLQTVGSYFIVDDLTMGEPVTTVIGEKGNPYASMQKIFPNPASMDLTFHFSLIQQSQISIGVYDLAGRKVLNVFSGDLHDGDYSIPANVQGLPDGLYFCRLTTESGSLTQKLMVLKDS